MRAEPGGGPGARRGLAIAVVGAGIAGLAVATLLDRAGHRVTVFERFDASRPVGSGLMLQPIGLAALDRLGLRAEMERRGARIDRLHGKTDRGITIFDLGYADLDPALYAVAVHRAALHGVLWQAFAAGTARLETGFAVAGLDDGHAAGALSLIDEAGRSAGPFALVVDASGAQSKLRVRLSAQRPQPYSYGAVWTTAPDIGIAPGRLDQRYVAARTMLGYLPVGTVDGTGAPLAALFWSLKPKDHMAWRDGFARWQAETQALWPALAPLIAALEGPDRFTLASYQHFTADRFHGGRLVLIGDAAHATSPQLGQGANQGLLDAVALADALDSTPDLQAALDRFERIRRRQIRFYQAASALMTPFFQSDSKTFALVRDMTFNRLKSIPYLRREMVRMLAGLKTGPLTHGSPAAIADPFGRPRLKVLS
ncbi:FAD-dependent urate hydroxylase [bacterium YEK0313]|nr:FAD-dependent urate hydroxylase [bacterium YEK0313]